ncbi:glycosyltransferase family 4 protein [Devosia sp. Root436]|uniref:MraY family glycosyltransferase n=1 Tax=Devosia sp. Root436 TaxID=1736537 RepID=UPI0012E38084|nr:glycosyltransferase family 4 protein [Devosia sp. Root436]
MFTSIALVIVSGVFAFAIALLVKSNAARLTLVQQANHRSSHVLPTPTGGGIGMAISVSCCGIALAIGQPHTGMAIAIALSVLIAIIGLLDDLWELPRRVRLLGHLVFSAILILTTGDLPVMEPVPSVSIAGPALVILLVFLGAWWINVFNFMDGIDGLAASQGVFMAVGACIIAALVRPEVVDSSLWVWLLCIGAAAAGFLLLNWPPAKIFMGDAGSTFLGYVVFAVAILSIKAGWMSYAAWAILAALFIVDTSTTLIRRMVRRERFLSAHRQHIYQRLSRHYGRHQPVTLLFWGANLVWVAPLAWLSMRYPAWQWGATLACYLPLIALALLLRRVGGDDR